MIRLLDFVFSLLGLIILFPILLLIGLWVRLDSKGPIFYIQKRVGLKGVDFNLYKFRTMRLDSDKVGLLTIGGRDSRITNSGFFIRKYKIDELPQLLNVFIGDMSLVGPRPEVRKYVALYDESQLKVLTIKPGITDEASIAFRNENEILAKSTNPELTYIQEIMPDKIKFNYIYLENQTILNYFKIIFKTILYLKKRTNLF
jgi:lipopolysaccharide/colanic/teichoic acid biosynthesis glycosyltransferase